MSALARFSELVAKHGTTAPPPQASTNDAAESSSPAPAEAPAGEAATSPQLDSPASKVPLPEFLERNAIRENPRIATAIVVWAADHDEKRALSTAEIRDYWKGTRLKVPTKNISRDIGKAVRSGWLTREGTAVIATGYGRRAIGLTA